jgi:peptide chain release factor 1
MELLDFRPGIAVLNIEGHLAHELFKDEAGGHRWQRVPPNERKGRIHTSTITVAVLRIPRPEEIRLKDDEMQITACRGSGPGGHNRNKCNTAIQIRHLPTGLLVRSEAERSQFQNRELALGVLRSKLMEMQKKQYHQGINTLRRQQVGTGMRGDKRRTIACQRGTAIDHITGKQWRLDDYLAGKWR